MKEIDDTLSLDECRGHVAMVNGTLSGIIKFYQARGLFPRNTFELLRTQKERLTDVFWSLDTPAHEEMKKREQARAKAVEEKEGRR